MRVCLALMLCCVVLAGSQTLISAPRGEQVTFPCNQVTGGARIVVWYYGHPANDHYVAILVNGNAYEYDQWIGRTNLDGATGDLTLDTLQLIDDGNYNCHYADRVGSSYDLIVTVPPSTPRPSGLDSTDRVAAGQGYDLTCVVDEVKPRAKIYWVIDDVIQMGTDTDVDTSGGGGIVKLTGRWTHTFTKDPDVQALKCRVTDWDDENYVLEERFYKDVDVYYAPVTFLHPSDDSQDPVEGSVYSLLCHVTDARPDPGASNYTWWQNQELLSEESGTLTLTLDRSLHDGTYACAASNIVGRGATSNSLPLKVYYLSAVGLGAFSSSPVVEGYETSATCSIDGYPQDILDIQWRRDGELVEDDGRIELEGATLRITSAQREDRGTYTCTITTAAGTKQSNQQELIVHYRPYGKSVLYVDKNPVAADEEVTFTCSNNGIDAIPNDFRYTFSREGETPGNVTDNTWSYVPGYVTVFADHHCVISNYVGSSDASNNLILVVQGPAYIEYLSEAASPVLGESELNITCVASGHERSVTWTKDGQDLPDGFFETTVDVVTGDFEYGQQEALRHQLIWIPPVAQCSQVSQHSGRYSCEAETVIRGQTRTASQSMDVTVMYAPINEEGSYIRRSSDVGGTITLPCAVCARPAPTKYTWSRHDVTIPGESRDRLEIHDVTTEDYGNYTCSVVNAVAEVEFTIELLPLSGPRPVENLRASPDTSQTLNVSFVPGFNGGLTQSFTLQYKLAVQPEEDDFYIQYAQGIPDPNPHTRKIPVTVEVDGLQPQTDYTFRVRAENAFEEEPFSPWMHVHSSTLVAPIAEIDEGSFSYDRESTRATFAWTVTVGKPFSLELWYRPVGGPSATKRSSVRSSPRSSGWSVMVSGIDPDAGRYDDITGACLDTYVTYHVALVTNEGAFTNPPNDDTPIIELPGESSGGVSVGAMVGASLGCLVLGSLVGAAVMFLVLRKRNQNDQTETSSTKRGSEREGNGDDGAYVNVAGPQSLSLEDPHSKEYYNLGDIPTLISPYEDLAPVLKDAPNIYDRITPSDIKYDHIG